MRTFDTGATRDTDTGKLDYEGFLSPLVLRRYAEYMNKNRVQADGNVRDSDNWQKGIPLNAYMKSGWRHFMDWWMYHRGPQYWPADRDCDHECEDCNLIDCDCADCFAIDSGLEDALCAMLFNVMGYLHEILKEKFDG